MASIAQAAKHLKMNERTFKVLIDQGVFERRPRSDYSLDTVRETYITHLRNVARSDNSSELTDARTRVANARASTAEHENEREQGKWVDFDLAVKFMLAELMAARENILAMAGVIADALHQIDREEAYTTVRRASFDTLDRLADGPGCARFAVNCAERSGGHAHVGLLKELVAFYKLEEVKRDA
jgi:hypothetical protein